MSVSIQIFLKSTSLALWANSGHMFGNGHLSCKDAPCPQSLFGVANIKRFYHKSENRIDFYSFYVLGARKRLEQSGKQEALIKFSNRWHDKTSSSFLKPLNWRYLVRKLYSVHQRRGQRTWMVTFLRRFLTLLNWIAMAFTWFALREF